jgi:hypothetical protein
VPEAEPDDFDTFSLRLPDPPALPPLPKTPEPEEFADDAWTDESEFDDEEPVAATSIKKPRKGEGVAALPRRIALEIIARWLWFIAAVELICATICIVLGIVAIGSGSRIWFMLIASGVSGIFSGLIFLAMSELLSMARAVEQRLYEIAENLSR